MSGLVKLPTSALLRMSILLLAMAGCGGHGTWREAYDEHYKSAYAKAHETGRTTGSLEGSKKGTIGAEEAVKTGHAWYPYKTFFAWSLFCGIVGGIFLQYLVLLAGNINGTMSLFWTAALVPGSTRSLAYSLFKRRRLLEIEYAEQLEIIRTTRDIEIAKLGAVQATVERGLAAATSIDDLNQMRLGDLAKTELLEVVKAAEERARQIRDNLRSSRAQTSGVVICPHCKKKFGFLPRAANKTVRCPHKLCRQSVTLPPCA